MAETQGGVVVIKFKADTTDLENAKKSISNFNKQTLAQERNELSKQRNELAKQRNELSKQRNELLQQRNAINQINAATKQRLAGIRQEEAITKQVKVQNDKINNITKNNIAAERNKIALEKIGLAQRKNSIAAINAETKKYDAITKRIKVNNDAINQGFKNRLAYMKTNVQNLQMSLSSLTRIDRSTKSIGTSLKGITRQLLAFASIAAIVNFAKNCVTASSDVVEVENVVANAFPNMTKEINEWAENSVKQFGMSRKAAKEYASIYGLIARSAGLSESDAYTLGTNLTGLTADIGSMLNMKNEEVSTKLRSGVLSGETESIKQLGISMTETDVQAWLLTKGINEQYRTMSQAEKIQVRYNYVLEKTALMQGDFARNQNTWANQLKQFSANIEELQANLGNFLRTALLPILSTINKIISAVNSAIQIFQQFLSTAFGIKFDTTGISDGANEISNGLDNIADSAENAAKEVKKSLGPLDQLNILTDNSSASSSAKSSGVTDLGWGEVKGGNVVKDNLEEIEKIIARIKEKLDFTYLFIQIERFVKEIKAWIKAIKDAWKDAWEKDDTGTKFIQSVIDLGTELLGLVNDISEAFRNMWEAGWGSKIFTSLLDGATRVNTAMKEAIQSIRSALNSGSGHYGYAPKSTETKAYEAATGNVKENNNFAGWRKDAKDFEHQDQEFRELTWGEYIATQVYKVIDAFIELKTTVLEWLFDKIENNNWQQTFDSWGDSLERIKTIVNDIADVFRKDTGEKSGTLQFLLDHAIDIAALSLLFNVIVKIITVVGGLGKAFSATFGIISSGFSLLASGIQAIPGIVSGALSSIGGFITSIFEQGGLFGGLFDTSILIAAITELTTIIVKMVGGIWQQVKEKGIEGLQDINFWLIELPQKCVGPITKLFSDIVIFVIQGLGQVFSGLSDWWTKTVVPFWNNTIVKGFESVGNWISNFFSGIGDTIASFAESVGEKFTWLMNKIKSVNSSISSATSKSSGGFGFNPFHFASGGVFQPNHEVLGILGDNKREKEYALTESHLDEIARRTASILQGGQPAQVAGVGNINLQIQMDGEWLDARILKVSETNDFRG